MEHNGSWGMHDLICPLTSNDQYVSTQQVTLGLDAEVLLIGEDQQILWPHEQNLPQERCRPADAEVLGLGNVYYDWHGDGFAHEVCTKPVTCLDVMMANLGEAFGFLNAKYKQKIKLHTPTVYTIPKAVRDTAPEEIMRLGCMPSLNVYGDSGTPESLGKEARTTGVHLHASHACLTPSLSEDAEATAKAFVRWADILVGCHWIYITPEESGVEAARREAYGRAGEYRRPTYPNKMAGVEYRVLPGRVLSHPTYLTLMFSLYRTALRYAVVYGSPSKYHSMLAQTAVNTADKKLAALVVKDLPMEESAREFIKFLAKHPLPVLSVLGWQEKGRMNNGHRRAHQNWLARGKKGA